MFNQFPYTNFHELNLDWIIEKVKAAYGPDNPPENVVLSVNGETGNVVLYPEASIQLPTVSNNNWNIYRFANGVTIGIEFTANDAKLIRGTHRDTIYTNNNPPPYPVTSVNGQTGTVVINFPVTSVNGHTGAVTTQEPFNDMTDEILYVDTDANSDYWGFTRNVSNGSASIYLDTANDNVNAYISFIPEDEAQGETVTYKLLTTADIPSSSGVVSINAKTGVVTLNGTDIYRNANSSQTVEYALSVNETAIDRAQTSIAIVSNNGIHRAIDPGDYVYIKRTTGITEGLYKAINAIPTNGAITLADIELIEDGGLNDLSDTLSVMLNTKLDKSIMTIQQFSANSPKDVIIGTSYRGFMFCSGPSVSCNGIIEVHSNTSGNPNFNKLTGEMAGITVSGSTLGRRTLTFVGNTHVMFITINGSVSFENPA